MVWSWPRLQVETQPFPFGFRGGVLFSLGVKKAVVGSVGLFG